MKLREHPGLVVAGLVTFAGALLVGYQAGLRLPGGAAGTGHTELTASQAASGAARAGIVATPHASEPPEPPESDEPGEAPEASETPEAAESPEATESPEASDAPDTDDQPGAEPPEAADHDNNAAH